MTDIFSLSDRAVDRLATADPLGATYTGIAGHDDSWTDLSPEGVEATVELHRSIREEALACDVPDDDHRLAQDVLVDHCDRLLADHEMGHQHYDLNNIFCPHQAVSFVFGMQDADTAEHWDGLLARLETVSAPLEGWRATLEEGRRRGRTVARRQVEAVIAQGESNVGDGSSFDNLRDRLAESSLAGTADFDRYADRLEHGIATAKTAYAELNQYLIERYLPEADETDPVGAERYLAGARRFLGGDIDPVATYRWGWDEVERLWSDMKLACAKIDADATIDEVVKRLQTDPAYGVDGVDEFVAVMMERQEQALANLADVHFDVPERIRTIDVKIEPPGGALGAQYVGPSEDFSRPGTVWYSVGDKTFFPLFAEISTAYHEGFPGHHLQVGVQAAMGDRLSRFHRTMVWYSGSGEGWALYAEQLMGELGYLERPEYEIGLLTSQLLRACRVAIDIGSHFGYSIPDDVTFHPGEQWTFELAHELLVTRGVLSPPEATSESLRYLGWPGQAISYKVGEQAILDLREAHRARPDFDLKRFHNDVLSLGAVGLDLLKDRLAVG